MFPTGTGSSGVFPVVKGTSWDQTHQGASLNGGYQALRTAFTKTMPSQRQQFRAMAQRPIGG